MTNPEPRTSVFHIDRIVKTSVRLFARNILLWLVIAVVLDVVSMRFADELRTAITSYMTDRFQFSPDLSPFTTFIKELPRELQPHEASVDDFLGRVVVRVTWFLALITLLQAMVSHLIFHAVKNDRTKISLAEAVSFLSKEGILVDLLRVIGITICVYLLMIGWFVVLLGTITVTSYVLAVAYENVKVFISVTVGFLTLLLVVYWVIRWALAIPVAVVENKSVFQSIARSYRLTRSCWLTVGVIEVIVIAAYFVVVVVMGMAVEVALGGVSTESGRPPLVVMQFVVEMVGTVLATIVLAACYYYVYETVPGAETATNASGGGAKRVEG